MNMAHYCQWEQHNFNLLTEMENMKADENYVDVTIVCEGKAIKLHKLMLSACSMLFHKIFLSNPCAHPVIVLQDIKFTIFEKIINFAYHGQVSFENDELELLLKAANSLEIKGLPDICEEMLLNILTVDVKESQTNNITTSQCSPEPSPQKEMERMQSPCILAENICLTSAEAEKSADFNQQVVQEVEFYATDTSDLWSDDEGNSILNSMSETSSAKKNATKNAELKVEGKFTSRIHQKKSSIKEHSRFSSDVWDHFTKMKGKGKCCHCQHDIAMSGGSTGNLTRHLRSKHPTIMLPQRNVKLKSRFVLARSQQKNGILQILRKHSSIWYHFNEKGTNKSECKYCKLIVSTSGRSTGNLARHLKKKHPTIDIQHPGAGSSYPSRTSENSDVSNSASSLFSAQPSAVIVSSGNVCLENPTLIKNELPGTVDETEAAVQILMDEGAIEKQSFYVVEKVPALSTDKIRPTDKHGTSHRIFQIRNKKRISYLWNYFNPLNDEVAVCKVCSAAESYQPSNLSNLKKHLKKSHSSIDLPRSTMDCVETSSFEPEITTVETQGANVVVQLADIEVQSSECSINSASFEAQSNGNQAAMNEDKLQKVITDTLQGVTTAVVNVKSSL